MRSVVIVGPAIALSRLPGVQLHTIWYLSVAAVFVQLALSMYLLSREFSRRLNFAVSPPRPRSGRPVSGGDPARAVHDGATASPALQSAAACVLRVWRR